MTDYAPLLAALNAIQSRVSLGGNHQYRADGKHMPGVTTIIKTMDSPNLDRWAVRVQVEGTARAAYANPPLQNEPLDAYVARMKVLGEKEKEHERLADEAAKIGTDVHALIEHTIRGLLGQPTTNPVVCEEALFRFSGWRTWAKSVGLVPLCTEARVYNEQHGYCGTVDAIVLIDGRPTLLDWKSSKGLYDDRRLQSAAYRKALASLGWTEMEGAIVVVPGDGGDIRMDYAEAPGPELDAAFDTFLALLKVYRWQAEVAKRARKSKKEAA